MALRMTSASRLDKNKHYCHKLQDFLFIIRVDCEQRVNNHSIFRCYFSKYVHTIRTIILILFCTHNSLLWWTYCGNSTVFTHSYFGCSIYWIKEEQIECSSIPQWDDEHINHQQTISSILFGQLNRDCISHFPWFLSGA